MWWFWREFKFGFKIFFLLSVVTHVAEPNQHETRKTEDEIPDLYYRCNIGLLLSTRRLARFGGLGLLARFGGLGPNPNRCPPLVGIALVIYVMTWNSSYKEIKYIFFLFCFSRSPITHEMWTWQRISPLWFFFLLKWHYFPSIFFLTTFFCLICVCVCVFSNINWEAEIKKKIFIFIVDIKFRKII